MASAQHNIDAIWLGDQHADNIIGIEASRSRFFPPVSEIWTYLGARFMRHHPDHNPPFNDQLGQLGLRCGRALGKGMGGRCDKRSKAPNEKVEVSQVHDSQ